ncbi:MAG: BMP family ABC transporter substrate-binding protein [Actinomycetota bacterium]
MTDENDMSSYPYADPREEIAHLAARRDYLARRMDAATDPNIRSSFAYEIQVLDDRLDQLTGRRSPDPREWPAPAHREPPPTTQADDRLQPPVEFDRADPDPLDPPPTPAPAPLTEAFDDLPPLHAPSEPTTEVNLSENELAVEMANLQESINRLLEDEAGAGLEGLDDRDSLDGLDERGQPSNSASLRPTPTPAPRPDASANGQTPPANGQTPSTNGVAPGTGHDRSLNGQGTAMPSEPTRAPQPSVNGRSPNGDEPTIVGERPGSVDRSPHLPWPSDDHDTIPPGTQTVSLPAGGPPPPIDRRPDQVDAGEPPRYEPPPPAPPAGLEAAAQTTDLPPTAIGPAMSDQPMLSDEPLYELDDLERGPAEPAATVDQPLARIGGVPATLPPEAADQRPGRPERTGAGSRSQPLPRPANARYGRPDPLADVDLDERAGAGGGFLASVPLIPMLGIILIAILGAFLLFNGGVGDDTPQTVASGDPAGPTTTDQVDAAATNVRDLLVRLGLPDVIVDIRDGAVHIGGPVPSQADFDAVLGAAQAVAGDVPVDIGSLVVASGGSVASPDTVPLAGPASPATVDTVTAVQSELDRIIAVNPLIFASGQATLTALHQRALDNAARVLLQQTGLQVTITGYTDELGGDGANRQLSQARADSVRDYLISLGVPAEWLTSVGVGEDTASGSAGLAGLERRVEFDVTGSSAQVAPAVPEDRTIRVGIVAPSARNDLAFTQSMVEAVTVVAGERNLAVDITDNTFVPEEAAAAVEAYADAGYDLIIAHGSQFGAALIDIAPRYPTTAFAWGTASDTFGLPNVYAYDAAAQEGGYVLGAIATLVSDTKVTGVVGPIEVGDAAKYVNGFRAGAAAQDPASRVIVTYTGSFSDIPLATETANAQLAEGADVLTGSAQMVVGAITAAEAQGARWFGTQADQSSLAPTSVVASQVYRWEVALRPILDDVLAGRPAGNSYTATLANGGLEIVFNPNAPVAPEVQARAGELIAAIANGDIVPPG